jgi:hypothetical protein
VNADEREEIAASVAAQAELGSRYDAALAEGLVERIGEEIDKRVDARLRGMGAPAQQPHQEPAPRKRSPGQQVVPPGYQGSQPVQASQGTAQPPARRSNGVAGVILGLGSMGLGVGATGIVASHHSAPIAQVLMILLIWLAIAIINVAYSQRS